MMRRLSILLLLLVGLIARDVHAQLISGPGTAGSAGAGGPLGDALPAGPNGTIGTATSGFSVDGVLVVTAPQFIDGDGHAGAYCDDSHDDATSIQAAINALPVAGGTIYVSGICKINSTLTVTNRGVKFLGCGRYSYQNANDPPCFLDATGITSGDALRVTGPGFTMEDMGVKYAGAGVGAALSAPSAPVLSQVAGAGCTTGNLKAEVTYANAVGESVLSAESNFTVTAGNCLQIASPAASGNATGYKVYIASNSNRETQQSATATALGVAYTMTAGVLNTGLPPLIDTSANAAVYASNTPNFFRSKIWSSDSASPAIGIKAGSSYVHLIQSYVQGFNVGIATYGFGTSNNAAADKDIIWASLFHSNATAIISASTNTFDVENNEFYLDTVADINYISGSGLTFAKNYLEMDNNTITNIVIGSATTLPQPTAYVFLPVSVTLGPGNYINCSARVAHPVITLNAADAVDIHGWGLSNCATSTFIHNPGTASNIRVRDNATGDLAIPAAGWLDSLTNVVEYDVDQTGSTLKPGALQLPNLSLTITSPQTLIGATPTITCPTYSAVRHAVETLGAATTITLPTTGLCTDGQLIRTTLTQPANQTYTVAFAAGASTTLTYDYAGGSAPTMPSNGAAVAQLECIFQYDLTNTTWHTLGCAKNPAAAASITSTDLFIGAGVNTFGLNTTFATGQQIAATTAVNAGHFTNLTCINTFHGTCTTPPAVNVFDGASNTGTALNCSGSLQSTRGTVSSQAQTLAFAGGDIIGIYVSTQGGTCTADQFHVSAEAAIP